MEALSGQRCVPVIEFEDGSAYRAESKEMAERIREGRLFEGQAQTSVELTELDVCRSRLLI